MRVALDLSSLDHPQLSGIGVYVGQLSKALASRTDLELAGVWKPSRFLKRHWISKHAGGLQTLPWLPWITERSFDIFHGPDFRLPELRKIKRVVTIHDLAFYQDGMTSREFAERSRKKVEDALLRGKPDCVIAVSDFTRQEILNRFPGFEGRVFTVHHGADHLEVPESATAVAESAQPYFLFVGNLEARKNLIRLLDAFEHFLDRSPQNQGVKLVLVGRPGFGFDAIEERIRRLRRRDNIEIRGYLPRSELIRLYRGAVGFLYPSLHEGFGFPILEAMRLGAPVLTSLGTATSEVAGQAAAILVNPDSVDEIYDGMRKLLEDGALRAASIARGKVRAESFRWAESARKTSLVYRAALASG